MSVPSGHNRLIALYRRPYADAMRPTERFSERVDSYVKYRPGYPESIIDMLKQEYGLSAEHEVADIGAGVGHSVRLFAPHVNYIYAVEPNREMFDAMQLQLREVANYSPRLQSAENTDLEARSVDFIVCGQSYHWFDPRKSRTEFERIINDDGYVVLMWNSRSSKSGFGAAYHKFLEEHSRDYTEVNHSKTVDESSYDYLMRSWKRYTYENSQQFDFEGLLGRYHSSSYALVPGDEGHDQAVQALRELFDRYSDGGLITFEYETEVIVGKI